MIKYDFTAFMAGDRSKTTAAEVATAAATLSAILNRMICIGYTNAELVPDGEKRFGSAQVEMTKLYRSAEKLAQQEPAK